MKGKQMSKPRNTKRKAIATPILFCNEHKCPMIQVGDDYVCVCEYTSDLIGTHKVVDAVPGNMAADPPVPISLIFDNGYSLPLLCPCCGSPIGLDLNVTGEQLLETVKDAYLVGLGYNNDQNALIMLFSLDPEADLYGEDVSDITVHFDSVRGLENKPMNVPGLDTSV